MGTAQGFWSYAHKDNDGMHGAIRRVADHVQDEYGVITGGLEIDLFLDSMKLKWGDKWRLQIRAAVEESTFFIPIITPRYFKSEECRNELTGFAEQAKDLGQDALIMPLYFVDVPEIESGESDDPLIKLVADCQMKDWRNLRFLDETTQPYRLALNELATRLVEVSRGREASTPPMAGLPEEDDDDEQKVAIEASSETDLTNSQADQGALELLVAGEDAFPRLVTTLNSISPEIEEVGDLAVEATKEIQESDASGGGFKGRLAVTRRLAKKLEAQADRLERLTSEYVADLLIVDPAMLRMIGLMAEQMEANPDEGEEFFSSIMGMIVSSEEAAEGIQAMIESIDGVADLSRDLNTPLNRLRSSLQSMIDSNRRMDAWKKGIEDARPG